jgi:DNA-binding NarL/FixJ family response regulator
LLSIIVREISDKTEIEYFTQWENALQAVNSIPPDFVITDIQIGDCKQLELLMACHERKIPCMVFSSYINHTILDFCSRYQASVVVAKSSPTEDLKKGVQQLMTGKTFQCEVCNNISHSKGCISEETPRVLFTPAEEIVIRAQIEGKSTIELSKETNKSKYTIRNQRMKLMEKNECTMEEIVRRYLFWHTNG